MIEKYSDRKIFKAKNKEYRNYAAIKKKNKLNLKMKIIVFHK